MSRRLLRLAWGVALAGASAACTSPHAPRTDTHTDTQSAHVYASWADPRQLLASGQAQNMETCRHPGNDLVRDLFCGPTPARFTSLVELERALQLDAEHLGGLTGLAVTAHSTALGIRSVSAINPRVLLLCLEFESVELVVLGFTRGEQLVELVVRDRDDKELRFYVVSFSQACNDSARGCLPGDLLTEAVEQDWLEVTLYDETTLRNTPLDCATCHQPEGPNTPKLLRMQELETPWTHWFSKGTEGGRALLDDYRAAKGDEAYAGVPGARLERATPGGLSMLALYSSAPTQPNMFDSRAIEAEVRDSAAALGGAQPVDNSVPGDSTTWRAVYDQAKRGAAIAVPYHDVKVTDPDKLERMTAAYQTYRSGELAREALPDIRDVFPDDPRRLAEMGMGTEPGMDGEAVLLQACSQCHNPRLDPSLSRARFRADLVGMSRNEKDLAIERLRLPQSDPFVMPPTRLRVLTKEARERAIEALKR
jgi:mono/diheme cytochrome c family protein